MRMHLFLSAVIFIHSYNQAVESRPVDWSIWEKLFKISWEVKYNAQLDAEVEYPVFSAEVKELEGKEIQISGYVVPVSMYSGDGSFLIVSAYPARTCFFCGKAGPETVIEIHIPETKVYKGDEKITFKGKLVLNPDDVDHLIYILEDAEEVGS